jgi:hypothetical protein
MRRVFVLLVCHLAMTTGIQCHALTDTLVAAALVHLSDSSGSLVSMRLTHSLECSLSLTNQLFLNWKKGNSASLVSLCNHLSYQSKITNDSRVTVTTSFVHDLGMQYFFDSILRLQPDANTLENRIEVRIASQFVFSLFSTLNTRIFNSYTYATNQQGNPVKILGSGFMTPFQWNFSAGFGWAFQRLGCLSLGLTSGKFTWIRNRAVYTQQNIPDFYGVPKEKNYVLEYGFNLHLLIDTDILKHVHWNCDLLIFKNYRKPLDMVLKSYLGIRINKFLRTSIQTHLYYEKEVSSRIQIENLFSMGFYVNL